MLATYSIGHPDGISGTLGVFFSGVTLDKAIYDSGGASSLIRQPTVAAGAMSGPISVTNGLSPSKPDGTAQSGVVYQGSGAPNNSYGNNGDVYFRTDTPGTANQRIYIMSAGSWVALV